MRIQSTSRGVGSRPRRRRRPRPLVALLVVLGSVAGACASAPVGVAGNGVAGGGATRTAVTATATAAAVAPPGPGLVTGDVTVHDPSMIRTSSGYLLISTHDALAARTSPDRIAFTRVRSALARVPWWVYLYNGQGDVWAPDLSYQGGTYRLYYSASSFGSNRSAIGLATSTTGAPGSFVDRGIVYTSTTSSNYNAIDPSLFVDPRTGRWWLTFGSHWSGIHMIAIDPATGMQSRTDRTRHHLAYRPSPPNAVEAPYILARGGYYYLFTSFDTCCRGIASTYRIMVGRSTSPTGPYVDRSGRRLLDGGGTELLASHGRVVGPGGQSVLRDVDGELLVYHYYDANAGGRETLGVNLLGWDAAGWPYVR
jgi:arabinan endo-1,5-alpha-L-arabinosidase